MCEISALDRFMLSAVGHCGGLHVTPSLVGDCILGVVDSERMRWRALFCTSPFVDDGHVDRSGYVCRTRAAGAASGRCEFDFLCRVATIDVASDAGRTG